MVSNRRTNWTDNLIDCLVSFLEVGVSGRENTWTGTPQSHTGVELKDLGGRCDPRTFTFEGFGSAAALVVLVQ